MKLQKSVNYKTLMQRLRDANELNSSLITEFKVIDDLFENTKLGIPELNYALEEQIGRWRDSTAKIEQLLRSL